MSPETALHAGEARGAAVGGSVDLRYVARTGLLPELSRQTYDSLWKAMREAVLNAVDADATQIDIDFSAVPDRRELVVSDNGCGMSTREFCEQFMSLGGSSKYGDARQFGRIGIGSLALLQYADAAIIETKRAGSNLVTHAEIRHPWDLGREQRHSHLGDLSAGSAHEAAYDGDPDDHFTRVRLAGVNAKILAAGSDPTTFYGLLERLRRVLPLPWAESPLVEALARSTPELVDALRQHVADWSAPVVVHSPWERDIELGRRTYGDDRAGGETWSGQPAPILKTLRIPGHPPRRRVVVAGYLLNQRRASASWSGLTARVQNVAVEENTFFDITADPGFRKYISGEIWLLGDLDRERLINIDRASFNRECPDYQVVQRFLSRAILDFKSAKVQRPQRAKVAARRRIEEHVATVTAIEHVTARAAALIRDPKGLPSSEPARRIRVSGWTILDDLAELGAEVVVGDGDGRGRHSYTLDVADDGERVRIELDPSLLRPVVQAGDRAYEIQFARAGEKAAAIVIRNRPRRIIVNLDHASNRGAGARKIEVGLALELSYLLSEDRGASGVYDWMLDLLTAL